MDMAESQNQLVIGEEDLGVFIRVYRKLKDSSSFRGHTRLVLLHVVEDDWEFRVFGLTSREWLEFCANVYADLPGETVNLVEEVQEYSPSDPVGTNAGEEDMGEPSADYLGEEEEEDADTANLDGETPNEEVRRKLRRPVVVRKTGNPAVTVETD